MGSKPYKFKVKSLGNNLKRFKWYLKDKKPNLESLEKYDLPKLTTAEDLASFLGISLQKLEYYCVAKKVVSPTEYTYRRFKIPKRIGGYRIIEAPKKELKSIQNNIYKKILKKIEPSKFAHGFREKHSILTNANVHLGAQLIYNVDIKNFFYSIKFPVVYGIFKRIGYSRFISSLLAALCTAPPRKYNRKKNVWQLIKNKLHYLPQGAPTSPALSNLACIDLDEKLNAAAEKFDFKYSRYADDLTFSINAKLPKKIQDVVIKKLRKEITRILYYKDLRLNIKKDNFARKFKPKRITGLIIHDDHVAIQRRWIRRLRAALHELESINADIDDPHLKRLIKNIEGRCAYALMINKEKYLPYYKKFKKIVAEKLIDKINYCPYCGYKIAKTSESECPNCGKIID
ncbi:MAG: reverse transcriptase domain-containing protein [Promethearchaeota archaeon]